MSKLVKGPRPLALHFSNSQVIWTAAGEGVEKSLRAGLWHPDLQHALKDMREQIGSHGAEKFAAAVCRLAAGRRDQFLAGINQYLSKDYERAPTKASICHKVGSAELYDYGGSGKPILMVPSLINPYYILDLMPGRSVAAYLKEKGYRPFLLNWGAPEAEEQYFGMEAYITERFIPMLEHVAHFAGSAVPLLGYCMGGTLSTAVAARTSGLVSKLVLLAAPWDFETEKPHAGRKYVPQILKHLQTLPKASTVAVEMLQTFFASVDPTLNDRKFRSYAAGKYQGEEAEFFSAMEVWANNSAPLARRAAEDAMVHWYKNNETFHERWCVNGAAVKLVDIDCPVFVAAPPSDRLVPEESALSVAKKVRNAVSIAPPSGHIGMVVGNRAKEGLWRPMLKWLEENSDAA